MNSNAHWSPKLTRGVGIAFGADALQKQTGLIALAVGAVLYFIARRGQ